MLGMFFIFILYGKLWEYSKDKSVFFICERNRYWVEGFVGEAEFVKLDCVLDVIMSSGLGFRGD